MSPLLQYLYLIQPCLETNLSCQKDPAYTMTLLPDRRHASCFNTIEAA